MADAAVPFQVPTLTALDATTQGIAAAVYLAIGVAAWLRAPLDVRTRVFLALAAANAAAFGVPAIDWVRGAGNPLQLAKWKFGVVLGALAVGALLLLHFLQVFPRRRPWIRSAPWQLPLGYVITPLVVWALIAGWPADIASMSPWYVVAMLLFGFPLGLTLALVVPVAGILSLLRSYREAGTYGSSGLKAALFWMLVSQIGGGALALVFAPVLAVLAPSAAVQNAMTITVWILGLLAPLAFAAAVWKYDVLSVPVD